SYCIDVFYRDAPLPRIRHMLNRRHMPVRGAVPESVCTLPKRGVMSLPKISNGRSRRIGERTRTKWLYAAEMETLRMITQGAGLTDILNHVCASIDRLIFPSNPLDGSGWAETPADCRSEGPSRVDACD